jgi:glycosyltransferase involved in cell wall biosynthesis
MSKCMPRSILSTGVGKLHFFESALALHQANYPIEVITGWRPQGGDTLVNLLGNLIGQQSLSKRLDARNPVGLETVPVYSCSIAEAYSTFLTFLSQRGLIDSSHAARLGFTEFGRASKKFLDDAKIFHVRSGAGQGGAIATARAKGMKILVDHSIAHPAAMKAVLQPEFERFDLPSPLQPDDEFWQLILKDCAEADLILVNSDYVKDTFIEAGYSSKQIEVVYWGVRQDFFKLKQTYQRSKEVRLLFTGHFDLRKGVRVLLEALEILQQQQFDYRLDVFGFMASGKHALSQHPALTNIHFHEFVPQDELKQFIIEADIFVFPTFAEGSARSAMEAMAAGLPVITTENCGVPIKHGVNGWYVPVGDSHCLANAICQLGEDEALRRNIGSNAYTTIAQSYTWKNYAHSVIEIYQKIAYE